MVFLFVLLFIVAFCCIYVPVWGIRKKRDKHTLRISSLGAIGFAGAFVNTLTSLQDDILYAMVIGAVSSAFLLFVYILVWQFARAAKSSKKTKKEKTDNWS